MENETNTPPPNTRPGRPRTIWVFGLAFVELAITILMAMISARLGWGSPAILAPLVAVVAAAVLAHHRERRAPGQLSWQVRAHLALRTSLLLGLMNGLAIYLQSPGAPLGQFLMITVAGTLLLVVLHLLGLQLGVTLAKLLSKRA